MAIEEKLELDNTYKTIAQHIQADDGKCVLILGPELAVHQSGAGYKSYFKDLANNKSLGIDVYFESENLFSFKDESSLKSTRDEVINFYRSSGDPVLLDMIARIRFPLIINVCPDTALNNLYKKKQIPFEKGFFTKGSKARFASLPYPSKEKPVIYNIFGSVESEPSMILTHSKLYETIEYLLPEQSLPDSIELFLDWASSFILLGVRFDSWYYQLICHKLKLKEEQKIRTNLGTLHRDENASVSMVVRKNFGLLFTNENPVQTVERIITGLNEDPTGLREKDVHGVYSLFVSYSWRDKKVMDAGTEPAQPTTGVADRETPVDYLEKFSALKQLQGLQFFRDHNDLDYGDSIDSYMTRIGKGKTVIRVVSDKYLRSGYCMIEAMRMSQYNDEQKRIYTVLWEDVDLNNKEVYREYWKNKCTGILENIDKLNDDSYDNAIRIYRFINSFMNELKDEIRLNIGKTDFVVDGTGNVSLTPGSQEKVNAFVQQIIEKMKEQ